MEKLTNEEIWTQFDGIMNRLKNSFAEQAVKIYCQTNNISEESLTEDEISNIKLDYLQEVERVRKEIDRPLW